MHIPGTITKAYSDELFGVINGPDELPQAVKENPKWAMRFIASNLAVTKEIDDVEREIRSILERLGVSGHAFIVKAYSIEELVLGVKHYLVAWSTMKDLMSNLINSSFDLGIHEKDLGFGMILRNEKVKITDIPAICKEHAKKVDVPYTDKQRNDAVHRGRLLDDEINKFRSRYNEVFAERYNLLNPNPISDEELKEKLKALNTELPALAKSKQEEYARHFELTMELNKDLAVALARVSVKHLNNVRI